MADTDGTGRKIKIITRTQQGRHWYCSVELVGKIKQ